MRRKLSAAPPDDVVCAWAMSGRTRSEQPPAPNGPRSNGRAVPPQRVISKRTADVTLLAMREAVTDGTGRKANSPYYDIFGKTGTAQLPNLETGGYYQDRYNSSFLGGAPVDAPRLVVGCFINDPDRSIGHYGGVVAGPAVRRVIERTLVYLGVPANEGTDPNEVNIDRYEVIE